MTTPHPLGNTALRTPKAYGRYRDRVPHPDESCFICEAPPLRQWRGWKIIHNDFPYDAVSVDHVMLVPKRHIPMLEDLNKRERDMLTFIRAELNKEQNYDALLENTTRGRTIHSHFHYHLLRWKRT